MFSSNHCGCEFVWITLQTARQSSSKRKWITFPRFPGSMIRSALCRTVWTVGPIWSHTAVAPPAFCPHHHYQCGTAWSTVYWNSSQPVARVVSHLRLGLPVVWYLTRPDHPRFWYKVRLTISLKTGQVKVEYFIRYSFKRHLSSSVTQLLSVFNKVPFAKCNF